MMKYAVTFLFLCSISQSLIGQNDDADKIICIVTPASMPIFPGGRDSMYAFIHKNLRLPSNICSIEGTMFTSFNIDEEGTMTNFEIKRGLQKALDEEVIRVFKLMPKWIPAKDFETKKILKHILLCH